MPAIEVQSSNLASISYELFTHTLEVEFKNGRRYRYFKVPPEIYDGLIGADSVGSFFHKHIRFSFKYEEITEKVN